jgi:Reversibly glycosylated polypeptide
MQTRLRVPRARFTSQRPRHEGPDGMRITIVTTTINIPVALLQYVKNARSYGHRDLDLIVIGDRKSPAETADFCNKISAYYPCSYSDIEAQREYMARFPELWKHIRFDCIQRRNIGMLMAWERGAQIIITIDDDNFVMPQDYIGLHSCAGSVRELTAYASTSGWFDVCSFLQVDESVRFYHRGYPQKNRWTEPQHFVTTYRSARRIAVNAGFWLDDPDIDALTRMDRQPVVRGLKTPWKGNFALQPGTWSPFNSQNTALMRDVVPAYFLSPYVGRYDDIWAAYIVNRIAEHLGDVISFGTPLVRQQRNPHNLWTDLDAERNGMIMTDDFCEALRSITLRHSSYHECMGEIAFSLPMAWREDPAWNGAQKECRLQLIAGLQLWHKAFAKLGAESGKTHALPQRTEECVI